MQHRRNNEEGKCMTNVITDCLNSFPPSLALGLMAFIAAWGRGCKRLEGGATRMNYQLERKCCSRASIITNDGLNHRVVTILSFLYSQVRLERKVLTTRWYNPSFMMIEAPEQHFLSRPSHLHDESARSELKSHARFGGFWLLDHSNQNWILVLSEVIVEW